MSDLVKSRITYLKVQILSQQQEFDHNTNNKKFHEQKIVEMDMALARNRFFMSQTQKEINELEAKEFHD